MDFKVISRRDSKECKPKRKYIHISICSPDMDDVELPHNENRVATLYLKFHDIGGDFDERTKSDFTEEEIISFSKDQAKLILDFVYNHLNEVEIIVVNCMAGISRSSAVAGALSKILNGDDMRFFNHKRWRPNSHVYKTILEAYHENLNNS